MLAALSLGSLVAAQQQQPRLRLLALGAVPGRETRRTLLGLDEIGILALRARAEDAGERA